MQGEIVVCTELVKKDKAQVTLKFSVQDSGIGMTARSKPPGCFNRLCAGRFLDHPQIWRHRPGVNDQQAAGRDDGRRNLGGKRVRAVAVPSVLPPTSAWEKRKPKNASSPPPNCAACKFWWWMTTPLPGAYLQEMLESFSFKVTLAASGKEGISELENAGKAGKPFELVIMDWKMPGMDGIEASKRIKHHKDLSKIPAIILVTAYGREEVMQQADHLGLEGFLLKPISPSMLFDAIMQAFGEALPETSRVAQRHEQEAGALKHIQGAHVLLVEDNEINQQVAREILQGAGLNVALATNGQEAVNAVKENEL